MASWNQILEMNEMKRSERRLTTDSPWCRWKHITKLDPDRRNPPELVQTALESGTDALMISGTQGITLGKVKRLLSRVKHHDIPIVL